MGLNKAIRHQGMSSNPTHLERREGRKGVLFILAVTMFYAEQHLFAPWFTSYQKSALRHLTVNSLLWLSLYCYHHKVSDQVLSMFWYLFDGHRITFCWLSLQWTNQIHQWEEEESAVQTWNLTAPPLTVLSSQLGALHWSHENIVKKMPKRC